MTIAREEIFGPVLSILPYKDEEDAVAIANDTVYGLAAYIQSQNILTPATWLRGYGPDQSISITRTGTRWHLSAATSNPVTGANMPTGASMISLKSRVSSVTANKKHSHRSAGSVLLAERKAFEQDVDFRMNLICICTCR